MVVFQNDNKVVFLQSSQDLYYYNLWTTISVKKKKKKKQQKNNKGTENEYFELSVICPINNITVKFFPERGRKNEKDEKKAQPLPLLQVRQEPSC